MRRVLIGVLAVLVVVMGLAYALQGRIAVRLMGRVLERNFLSDFIAELPDGLHVALCGAGGPLPDPKRSGPCVAVVAGRDLYIVDAGTMGGRNLGPMRLNPGRIDAILLTHFHSDHIDGLGELALLRWAQVGNAEPAPVYGPEGVENVVAGFNRAYAQDFVYRVAHHGAQTLPPSGAGMEARPFATPVPGREQVVLEQNGLVITTFRVDHDPVDPAVGYRFDYGGRSVLVSGDTKKSAELQRMAKGVDLLVHEVLSAKLVGVMNQAAEAAGNRVLTKITADIPDYHTTPVEVAEIARDAEVDHLLYYHVVPPLLAPGMESVLLEGVAETYDGPVTVGIDGTMISLPRDSDVIELR